MKRNKFILKTVKNRKYNTINFVKDKRNQTKIQIVIHNKYIQNKWKSKNKINK